MGCADSKEKTAAPTIKAGEQLNKGQSIVSANGRFKFIVQEDGNAVIYRGERALWATHTDKKTVTHITLLADGVLILKNAEETVWATETKDSGADKLTIQDDGNLVLLDKDGQVKWESKSTFDDGQYDLRTKSAVVAAKAPIGVHVEAGKTYYWCTCGKSKNQPFCDGSHQGSDFKPLAWTAPEAKEVYFCVCKKTDNAPFCDGAHSKIEEQPVAAAAPPPPAADESQYDLRTKSAVIAARKPLGVHVEAGKTYYWCTCGKSKNQPFCDGSHQGSDFQPLAWTAPEAKEVYFCLCKQTKNGPFCDGAHASLPDESQYDLRTKSAVVALRRPLKVSLEAGKTYYWCTCGKSKNQPWCDGSHQGTEFKPLAWTAPESKEAFICACKQTKNAPFCDGAHRELPPTDTLQRSTTDYLIAGGAGIKSKNGKYRVLLQTDGNVVLYEGDVDAPEHAKWATATDGKGGFKFIIQNDGNVVLYNKEDHPLWASNTDGSAATRLVVTDDGKLVLFGEGDHHIWSS